MRIGSPRLRRWALLLFTALLPLLAQDNLKYGRPGCAGQVLNKKFFALCYDQERKIPAWVGYALTREDLTAAARREGGFRFRPDPDISNGIQPTYRDYEKSGYDIGHMAPAADFARSVEAMRSTFVFTNAVPQNPGLNRGQWRQLEKAVRSLASSHGKVWVFSGPVFAGRKAVKTIGPRRVAVPTHTYKVVLCVHEDGTKEMFAFVLVNVAKPRGPLENSRASVNQVEALTGLDFFPALPAAEQEALERAVNSLPPQ